ncbi:MAG: peptidylprolyl isomerase [Lentisphaeria bacterium]|nr:peptidylprolyl isomerase [Lentisphaeria bacterium]
MKKIVLGLMLVVFSAVSQAATAGDGILATVNGEAITYFDVVNYNRYYEYRLTKTLKGKALKKAISESRRVAAETLINNKLMLLEFATKEYSIPVSLIEEKIDEAVLEHAGGDRDRFKKNLLKLGDTFEEYKEKVRDRIIQRMMLGQFVYGSVEVSDQEVDEYIDANKERFQIKGATNPALLLLKSDGKYKGKLTETCEAILQKIKKGVSFAELVTDYSEGPKVKQGGDLGWLEQKDIRAEFKTAVNSTKVGECSPFITLPNGMKVIFKVLGKREAKSLANDPKTFDQAKKAVTRTKQNATKKIFFKKLRDKNIVREFF